MGGEGWCTYLMSVRWKGVLWSGRLVRWGVVAMVVAEVVAVVVIVAVVVWV